MGRTKELDYQRMGEELWSAEYLNISSHILFVLHIIVMHKAEGLFKVGFFWNLREDTR